MELRFTMKKQLWHFTDSYGTLNNYGKDYDTFSYIMKLWFDTYGGIFLPFLVI